MVKSLRLDEQQSKMLKIIAKKLDCSQSTAIKKAITELYEDLIDLEFIEEYDKKLKNNEVKFYSYKDIVDKQD